MARGLITLISELLLAANIPVFSVSSPIFLHPRHNLLITTPSQYLSDSPAEDSLSPARARPPGAWPNRLRRLPRRLGPATST
jgi:hypothetical protein